MDKWLKDILPDKDPYHNRGRDQMRKKGGSGIRVPVDCGLKGSLICMCGIIVISYHSENHFRTITISYRCHFVPYADRYIITISYHMQIDTLWSFHTIYTAGNRHKQNSWFCKEIREDNFRFWWRRVHEDASQGMYMSKSEIFFLTARILQNQRMLCCGECFHD
jgi:hypothetical protein